MKIVLYNLKKKPKGFPDEFEEANIDRIRLDQGPGYRGIMKKT